MTPYILGVASCKNFYSSGVSTFKVTFEITINKTYSHTETFNITHLYTHSICMTYLYNVSEDISIKDTMFFLYMMAMRLSCLLR